MADVSVKMGVSGISQFKSAMSDASASVKMLDTALKLNEEQLKATGDKETYLQNKMVTLRAQIEAQTKVVNNAEQAWKALVQNGADPMSKAAVEMQAKYYAANTTLIQMTQEMKKLESGETQATEKAGKLSGELQGIGKGVAWENVTDGIGRITQTLESGARAAINFGKKIAQSVMGSAEWADDVLTRAAQNGVDAETIQRMDNVAAYIDTDVETILNARDRLEKGLGKKTAGTMDALAFLGITDVSDPGKVFWEAGKALMAMTDTTEQEAKANDLFGKSWKELIPLFKAGEEEYERLINEQNVLSNEQVQKLGQMDDDFKRVQQEIERTKNEFWANNAENITTLLQWIVDNADGVKTGLLAIGAGFAGLKVTETALNLKKVIDGFKQLGLLKGGAEAAGAASGGGSIFASIAGKLAGAGGVGAGGLYLPGAGIVLKAGWDTAWKMIEANLKDASLNQVYGDNGGEGGVIDNLNDLQAQMIANYFKQWRDAPGTEDAFDARDALQRAFEDAGVDLSEQAVSLVEKIFENYTNENDPDGMVAKMMAQHPEIFGGEGIDIPVNPEPAPGAEEMIQEKLNAMKLYAEVELIPKRTYDFLRGGAGGGGGGRFGDLEFHANGLPYVPFDGYGAILHKGERVIPARAMSNTRNYNSNLYVENMVMNNGQDADGLALRVAAAQRQMNRGYGS